MSEFTNHGGQQFNAPGGVQYIGIPPEKLPVLIAQATAPLVDQIAAAGVREDAIIRLARNAAGNVADWQSAVDALTELVGIAIRVQEEGRHGSNLGDFVDEVLRRVTALSADGAHATAIDEIEDALGREDAESTARKLRLLKSAIDQHLLAFDPDGAAAKIARRVEIETPDPAAGFEALRKEWRVWYERGRDKGLNLDLAVAIALARAAQDMAKNTDQRGASLNALGNALLTLGEREPGTARLEEAVAAYRAALEERTRERVPLDWATTQNNLGNALLTLGERETGTARLEEAVAAYRAALEECTRERVPLDWAMTQNNLGNALRTLGERESGTARLEEAVAAYRAALEERTRERVPLDWAMTQNNLGTALRDPRGARERHRAARGGRRRLPRRPGGMDPRARAARLGHDPEQPRQRAPDASGSARAAPPGSRRPSPPTAPRSRNAPATACRSTGP